MKKKILIMTVYAPSEYNHYWYKLQKHFIKNNTTVSYDFKIVANNVDIKLFDPKEVVINNNNNIGHPSGIRQIIQYMKENNEYSGYLLLDSDSFPVRKGWHEILDQQMIKLNKSVAAPIRFENLDLFPHPCSVYIKKDAITEGKINFDYAIVKNLMGDNIDEVGGNMLSVIDDVMPLLRTNRINLHPVAAGIYHHLFYHHGAGSRGFDFRLLKMYEYYNHWIDNESQEDYGAKLIEALVSDPEGFIDKLLYAY